MSASSRALSWPFYSGSDEPRLRVVFEQVGAAHADSHGSDVPVPGHTLQLNQLASLVYSEANEATSRDL